MKIAEARQKLTSLKTGVAKLAKDLPQGDGQKSALIDMNGHHYLLQFISSSLFSVGLNKL